MLYMIWRKQKKGQKLACELRFYVSLFVTISREKEKLAQVLTDLRERAELLLVVLCGRRTES